MGSSASATPEVGADANTRRRSWARVTDFADTLPVGESPGPDPATPMTTMTTSSAQVDTTASGRSAADRLGRFTLLERLGQGAMGVVYTAYDPTLDRKVAVKVLHDRRGNQLRLVREAQAMARLSHPHVVTVLEAGVTRGRVYVAMEFIRGTTLEAWLAAERRSWSEILDVFLQAGRGLQAAHAAGLVHRDFKPRNVMIDESGRVRVLDFGLVRATGGPSTRRDDGGGELPLRESQSQLHLRLTRDDEVVGTPAYIAPELWRGLAAEPASDQFSFCVALYEALFGRLPFPDHDNLAFFGAVLDGRVIDPPRGSAPSWLCAAVLRGLRPAPADRHPSLHALLTVLARRRQRVWRGGLWALALAAAAGVVGFVAASGPLGAASCTGGDDEIAAVWGPSRRGEVATALRRAAPNYAELLWPRIAGDLDTYTAEWRTIHREACVRHREGERSGFLLDRQMRCLDHRRRALDEAVKALVEVDAAVATRALEIAGELPPLAGCRDLAALASERPTPDDPVLAARAQELRGAMARAEVLGRGGRIAAALELADTLVVEAEALGDPPALAEALLLRGRLGIHEGDGNDQVEALSRAVVAGFAAGSDGAAAEALALRIFARSRIPGLAVQAPEDEALALALAPRSGDPEALRGLVLNNVGAAHLALGDPVAARRYFEGALAVREAALGADHRDVAFTLMNLALVSDPGPARAAVLERALAIFDAVLGPAHPETIDARIAAANLTLDPAAALAILRPGCLALGRFAAGDVARRASCLLGLARDFIELGDDAGAVASLREARALADDDEQVPLRPVEAALLAGLLALHERDRGGRGGGDRRRILARLEAAIAGLPEVWWARADAAELALVLGQNLAAVGERARALTVLEASVEGHLALAADDPAWRPRLARARRSLAEALAASDPSRAIEAQLLLTSAIEFYRGGGPSFSRQLEISEAIAARLAGGVDPPVP